MSRVLGMLAACLVSGVSLGQSSAATEGGVALFVSQRINFSADEAEAFAAVCADSYTELSHRRVLPLGLAAQALETAGDSAHLAATALGAAEYLDLNVVRLSSSKILVVLTRARATGETLREARIQMATLTDIPAACNRLVRATLSQTTVAEAADRGNITRAEVQTSIEPTRLGFERLVLAKVAMGVPLDPGYQPMGSLHLGMEFEREQYMIEASVGFYAPSAYGSNTGYGGLSSEISANYLVGQGNNALFAGAGVEPRINFGGSVIELAPFVQVGGMVWRNTSARLFAELRLAQNLLPVTNDLDTSTTDLTPTELTLYIGAAFGG